jgi:hypothetical protein
MFAQDANGEWVPATYTYNFGPEVSQKEACQKAERGAKEKALKSIAGEKIWSEDTMVCSEPEGAADCSFNRFTWSMIDGLIKATRNKRETVGSGTGDYKKCTVTLEVDIGVAEGRSDPSLDLQVKLNRRTFRDGEALKIKLNPTQAIYISVFLYSPYTDSEKRVSRIFPNTYDKKQLFQKAGTVPTQEGSQRYNILVEFPGELKRKKKVVDEYLMVLGTKHPVKLREEYSLEEFNARLLEIPRQDRRIIRRGYNVVRKK